MKSNLLALGCGILGGLVGYAAYVLLLKQGFYALALPGGLLGMGAGMVRNKTILVAVACGLMATALGVYAEWRYFPFKDDESLAFLITHFNDKEFVTKLMVFIGGFIGFWAPFQQRSRTRAAVQPPAASSQ